MTIRFLIPTLCVGLLTGAANPPIVDLTGYRPQPGLEAVRQEDTLTVRWDGESEQECLARFTVLDGVPTVRELAVRKKSGNWVILGRDLMPEFGVTTGLRRTGHGLPEENRWDVFWDAPLNHPEEVRRSTASYQADRMEVRSDGARLEISFPGLSMGVFSGGSEVHGLPGDQPAPAGGHRQDRRALGRLHLQRRPQRLLAPSAPPHPLARRVTAIRGRPVSPPAGSSRSQRPPSTEPAGGRRRDERFGRRLPAAASVLFRP